MRADPAFAVAPVTTQSATHAYPLILSHAGCVRPARDAVDARVISEMTNGTTTYLGSKSINPPPGLIDSQMAAPTPAARRFSAARPSPPQPARFPRR